MIKHNYYLDSIEELERIKNRNLKPKLLLHACCAPCSAFVLEFLSTHFNLTIYYNNDNIYPEVEYQKRLQELIHYVELYNEKTKDNIQIIIPEYNPKSFHQLLEQYGNEPEGGIRCQLCYRMRMKEAYRYAKEHNYDYFTTVMTISRQKNSQILNLIGKELEQEFLPVRYFYSDFKKKDGLLRRNELVKEYNLYNQQYCGCAFSYADYLKRVESKRSEQNES